MPDGGPERDRAGRCGVPGTAAALGSLTPRRAHRGPGRSVAPAHSADCRDDHGSADPPSAAVGRGLGDGLSGRRPRRHHGPSDLRPLGNRGTDHGLLPARVASAAGPRCPYPRDPLATPRRHGRRRHSPRAATGRRDPRRIVGADHRQAALVVVSAVQQRITTPSRLGEELALVRRHPRRSWLGEIIRDVADGAHALGELDFAATGWSSRSTASSTSSVSVRSTTRYARTGWSSAGRACCASPLLGLRIAPGAFLDQVEDALVLRRWSRHA